ncbi:spindle assembly abnormal protein 6 homolog isoform X2 [Rhineura floridana]|uniref:spindle assembly abnormal protein 6 homolog isoform X2 n=1 Tax=Rhineura floridana TaxID=261503 RepID=UPI002AC7FBC1|nr:spindle assembly abnormal protein 6 homolog isoform X2 [Rhineura floridana]
MATETLFSQLVPVQVKCQACEERRINVRVSIELQSTTNPIHRKDLVVRLTEDSDPFFLYNLVISEEDFQSLKLQQSLLVDFSAFPQRFMDLLQHCIQEQNKDIPRFLLQLVSSGSNLDHTPAFLNVVETNPFKHLNHLSLKFLPGNDAEIKKFLATCLKCVKEEKLVLQQKLSKTEEDLTRQLNYTQQSLSEKSRELDKLRNEWTSKTSSLTNKHSQELTNEKEKALQAQAQYQQQYEQQKRDLENLHQKTVQQLQNRLKELEIANKDLMERRYKGDSTVRELKAKLSGIEDECQRTKQEVLSLRRENATLDAECHEKEKQVNQLQTRVAVLEQEIKDKEELVTRTKEVLDATQEQKANLEKNTEKKQIQIGKLEAAVNSVSAELLKANEIIKKLQGDVKTLMSKLKLKNTVTIQQEKLLAEKEGKLQKQQKDLQEAESSLREKEQEVCKLQEQLETTVQKLEESKHLLKTNENVITWLNKQLNEIQMTRKQEVLGTSTSPSNTTSRTGISPHSMVDSRIPFLSSGLSYPISPLLPFQSFPDTVAMKSTNQQASGTKVQFNMQPQETNRCSDLQPRIPVLISHSTNKENGENMGLEAKYLKKREDSIPLRGLSQNTSHSTGHQKSTALIKTQIPSKAAATSKPSAYFPG